MILALLAIVAASLWVASRGRGLARAVGTAWIAALVALAATPSRTEALGTTRHVRPTNGSMTCTAFTNVLTVGSQFFGTCTGIDTAAPPSVHVFQNDQLVATTQTVSWTTTNITASTASVNGSNAIPLAAGTYDVLVTGAAGSTAGCLQCLTVVTGQTLSTIFGTGLRGDYPAKNALCSGVACADGGTVTSWTDSANGQTLTCHGGVTYKASDPAFGVANTPSVVFDGTSGYCEATSFSLNGVSGFFVIATTYTTTAFSSPPQVLAYYGSAGANAGLTVQATVSNNPQATYENAFTNTYTQSILNSGSTLNGGSILLMGTTWNSTPTYTFSSSVQNQPAVTATSPTEGTNFPTTDDFRIGAVGGASASNFYPGHIANLSVVNVIPSSVQSLGATQYENLLYNVTDPPDLASCTALKSGGTSTGRCWGAGKYQQGMTVSIDGVAATGLFVGTPNGTGKYVDYTSPSVSTNGGHNVTLLNSDGVSRTFASGVTAASTDNPETCLGAALAFWTEGPVSNWICPSGLGPGGACTAGDKISQENDLGGLQNNVTQGAGTSQPPLDSTANASFNSRATFKGAGGPFITNTTEVFDGSITPAGRYLFLAGEYNSGGSGNQNTFADNTGVILGDIRNPSGSIQGVYNSTAATFSSSASTTPHYWVTRSTGTGTVTIGADQDDDGASEVTTTTSATPSWNTSVAFGMLANPNGGGGPATATIAFAAMAYPASTLTSAQLKCMCTYVKNNFLSGITCACLLPFPLLAGRRRRRAANDNARRLAAKFRRAA